MVVKLTPSLLLYNIIKNTIKCKTSQKIFVNVSSDFHTKLLNSAEQIKLLNLKKYSVVQAVSSQASGLYLRPLRFFIYRSSWKFRSFHMTNFS